MATSRTKDSETTKVATLDEVLGAVKGVGRKVDGLARRVDVLDKRVTVLEAKPDLKTRVVQQTLTPNPSPNGRGGTSPQVTSPQQEDEGEEEALLSGTWEKVVKTSRCYRIDVTKVRSPQFAYAWKLLLRLRGQRRPATIIGFNGTDELIDLMREVWPTVNEDIFDEAQFEEAWTERRKSDAMVPMPIIYSEENVHFLVDWFRTAPNYRGHTFINVEGVYPLED